MAESLKALGYKVLLCDRPNTGASGLLFEGENLLRIGADQLHELLHYTWHTPAFISGGSGGYLASLYFAYIYPAETAQQRGMTAVLEAIGGMWDFFDWPDQFKRLPQKKRRLRALDPLLFARTMRAWARSFAANGRPCFAGLTDEQLATINISTPVFSGLDGIDGHHPRHTAEALQARMPKSTLVITTEQYAETVEQILRESKAPRRLWAVWVSSYDRYCRTCNAGTLSKRNSR